MKRRIVVAALAAMIAGAIAGVAASRYYLTHPYSPRAHDSADDGVDLLTF